MSTPPPAKRSLHTRRAFATIDSVRQRVGVVLGPALFLGCGTGLSALGLEGKSAWTAATVALMAAWWITEPIPLWATACLPLILFPLFGTAPLTEVAATYLDPVSFLFLGGMLIAASMQQWGLHRRIALGIIAKIGTSPRRIVLGFMLATGFITLWISNTATAMMMFPIGMAILKKFEEQTGSDDPLLRRFGLALMLGMAYAASIGGVGTKIGTGPNLVFVKQAAGVLPQEVDFVTWLKVGMPVVVIALPLVWWYLVHLVAQLPAGETPGGREAIAGERARLGPMQGGEWAALAAFLMAAGLWIFRKDIELGREFSVPGWSRLIPFGWSDLIGRPTVSLPGPWPGMLAETGDAIVAMTIGAALFFIPVQRRPLRAALKVSSTRTVAWGLLILMGGGFAMAYGIQKSGLSSVIAQILGELGRPDPFVALLLVCFIATLLTEVASNSATASILLPLLAAAAPGFGLHPGPLMFAATLSASFGFMLPAGTPPNAIAFASGYIAVPQMARCGLVVDLAGVLLIATICHFLVPLAFDIR